MKIWKSLIVISLHDIIQIHQIAVEKMYHVCFRVMTGLFLLVEGAFSKASIYSVAARVDGQDILPPS